MLRKNPEDNGPVRVRYVMRGRDKDGPISVGEERTVSFLLAQELVAINRVTVVVGDVTAIDPVETATADPAEVADAPAQTRRRRKTGR